MILMENVTLFAIISR